MTLKIGDLVQTLYTPSHQGRSICVPIGSIGRIEEKYHGMWAVKFDLPLVTSDGGLFFYDEEKETIGCMYLTNELRFISDGAVTHSTLVWLVPEQNSVAIYDVSRWGGLLEKALQGTLETCPLLYTHIYDPYSISESALFQALLYCFEQGYHVQNIRRLISQETLKECIRSFQHYIMDKEHPFERKLDALRSCATVAHAKERSLLDSQLLPYQELAYLFMHTSDESKMGKPTFKNELALLTGRIEALESIFHHLSKHVQEQILKRLDFYYRAQAVIQDWRNVCR